MKRTLRRACMVLMSNIMLAFALVLHAPAASLRLDFHSPGGTVLDVSGAGAGFTARMSGSGAALAGNDPNLLLRTGVGVLQMRASPGANFNANANMASASIAGVDLSTLGFTGGDDFVAKASFINLTNLHGYPDQLCLVVGTSTTNLIRAGFINFDQYHSGAEANEAFAMNTVNGSDTTGRYYGTVVGGTMTVEIRRASGQWFVTVNGVDRLPYANPDGSGQPAPPNHLDAATNLFVGVVAMDVGNDGAWYADLDSFSVSVSPVMTPSVVAYWRFESGPAMSDVLHAGADGVFNGTTPDASGNGNSLSAWRQGGYAGFAYRSDRPFAFVPQTGHTNNYSIKNTGAYPAMFTRASSSLPPGINADTMTPSQFTVEACYKPEANGGHRTVVGRDARNVSKDNADLAAFYLQIRPDDSVGVTFTDVSGYTHSAFSPPGWVYGFTWASDPEATNMNAVWYRLAAVSDGDTLKLHVNNRLVGWTDLTLSGSPNRALAVGSTSAADFTAGSWTVGRGLYAGGHVDRAYGFIDEVRICNSALIPGQFLAAPRPHLAISVAESRLNITRGEPGATFYLLKSTNLAAPVSQWIPGGAETFDLNGMFTTSYTKAPGSEFFYLRTQLQPPISGTLTYKLAGGHESWPADIRAQIIYAMDGAVATYNRYGVFRKTLTANYNAGVPTAQAGYSGWIDFGGSRNYRVAMHEISHALGVGTYGSFCSFVSGGVWTGPNGVAQTRQFDGAAASLSSDCTHIWPYGLNYDSEGGTENFRRHVLIVRALRRDMGIPD